MKQPIHERPHTADPHRFEVECQSEDSFLDRSEDDHPPVVKRIQPPVR